MCSGLPTTSDRHQVPSYRMSTSAGAHPRANNAHARPRFFTNGRHHSPAREKKLPDRIPGQTLTFSPSCSHTALKMRDTDTDTDITGAVPLVVLCIIGLPLISPVSICIAGVSLAVLLSLALSPVGLRASSTLDFSSKRRCFTPTPTPTRCRPSFPATPCISHAENAHSIPSHNSPRQPPRTSARPPRRLYSDQNLSSHLHPYKQCLVTASPR